RVCDEEERFLPTKSEPSVASLGMTVLVRTLGVVSVGAGSEDRASDIEDGADDSEEEDATADLPELVSRLRRFRSARSSMAVWQRRSRSFSRHFERSRSNS